MDQLALFFFVHGYTYHVLIIEYTQIIDAKDDLGKVSALRWSNKYCLLGLIIINMVIFFLQNNAINGQIMRSHINNHLYRIYL